MRLPRLRHRLICRSGLVDPREEWKGTNILNTRALSLIISAALAVVASPARAQQPAETVSGAPAEAAPQKPKQALRLLDERTAYTIGGGKVKLGLLAFEFGIVDRVSVGTDPPAWAARSVLSILVPNLHVKAVLFQRGPATVALKVGAY